MVDKKMIQFAHDNYEHYHHAQRAQNRNKKTRVWVQPDELKIVAKTIAQNSYPQFGVCHGVRTGTENRILSELLGAEVIGTDLVGRDNVKEMDFHDEMPQWEEKADFIYSNSLDHSYDPDLALRRWIKCLRPGGIILIHWDPGHGMPVPTAADCFRASADEYRTMLLSYGKLTEKITNRPTKKQTVKVILFILKPKAKL